MPKNYARRVHVYTVDSFMISVQLNLDQKLNRVHAELRCTNLNSYHLIQFSWTAVVISWTMLIG